MQKQNYEVEVLVNGKPLKEYKKDGRTYVEGRKGTTFSLRLRNNSWKRKLFIPSIDGLSVMNGGKASFDSSGYIVRPYSSITVEGWRTSDSEVARFYFSDPQDSYAEKIEKGENLGIIGVAVFDEKEKPQPFVINSYPTVQQNCLCHHCSPTYTISTYPSGTTNAIFGTCTSRTATAASLSLQASSTRASAKADLGTGFGESARSEVTSVEFERGSQDTLFEIHYGTREWLEDKGVDLKREAVYIAPQAFPGQYCKPPKD